MTEMPGWERRLRDGSYDLGECALGEALTMDLETCLDALEAARQEITRLTAEIIAHKTWLKSCPYCGEKMDAEMLGWTHTSHVIQCADRMIGKERDALDAGRQEIARLQQTHEVERKTSLTLARYLDEERAISAATVEACCQIRRAAPEQAGRACERVADDPLANSATATSCADAIRALRGEP